MAADRCRNSCQISFSTLHALLCAFPHGTTRGFGLSSMQKHKYQDKTHTIRTPTNPWHRFPRCIVLLLYVFFVCVVVCFINRYRSKKISIQATFIPVTNIRKIKTLFIIIIMAIKDNSTYSYCASGFQAHYYFYNGLLSIHHFWSLFRFFCLLTTFPYNKKNIKANLIITISSADAYAWSA